MKRIRLPIGRIALVAGFFLFALLALLPMRLALDRMGVERGGLSARAATGSVWNGALERRLRQAAPGALADGESGDEVDCAQRDEEAVASRHRADLAADGCAAEHGDVAKR